MKIYQNTVVWSGTAEVNHRLAGEKANDSLRVQAALVETPKHKKLKTLVNWEDRWIPVEAATFCREFEDEDGNLITDTAPELAGKIEKTLEKF